MGKQFDTTELNRALGANLPAYLEMTGRTPCRSGGGYRLKENEAHYFDPSGWHKEHNGDSKGDIVSDYMAQTGMSFKDAAETLAEWIGTGRTNFEASPEAKARMAEPNRRAAQADQEQAKRNAADNAAAVAAWERAEPLAEASNDTPAWRYLTGPKEAGGRGFPGRVRTLLSHDVRFGAYRNGSPAILKAVRRAQPPFDMLGVHATTLTAEGSKISRRQWGTAGKDTQRAIFVGWQSEPERLAKTKNLALAEGLEDALSAMILGSPPCWSTLDAGTLGKIEPVQGIEALTVIADQGEAGESNAIKTALRWREAGRQATVLKPINAGDIDDARTQMSEAA